MATKVETSKLVITQDIQAVIDELQNRLNAEHAKQVEDMQAAFDKASKANEENILILNAEHAKQMDAQKNEFEAKIEELSDKLLSTSDKPTEGSTGETQYIRLYRYTGDKVWHLDTLFRSEVAAAIAFCSAPEVHIQAVVLPQ